jgi:phosphoglycolate phosphatase
MRAIGVLWGYGSRAELEAAGADALADTPGELVTRI